MRLACGPGYPETEVAASQPEGKPGSGVDYKLCLQFPELGKRIDNIYKNSCCCLLLFHCKPSFLSVAAVVQLWSLTLYQALTVLFAFRQFFTELVTTTHSDTEVTANLLPEHSSLRGAVRSLLCAQLLTLRPSTQSIATNGTRETETWHTWGEQTQDMGGYSANAASGCAWQWKCFTSYTDLYFPNFISWYK